MREEPVPEEVGKGVSDASKDGKEVCFEGTDGPLGDVASVYVWGHQLEVDSPVFRDDSTEGSADFVVHNLEIDSVTALFESLHDDVVSGDAVAVVLALKWLHQDRVAVAVVG